MNTVEFGLDVPFRKEKLVRTDRSKSYPNILPIQLVQNIKSGFEKKRTNRVYALSRILL